MDEFEAALKKNQKKLEPNIEGTFECQECDEYVTQAYSDRKTGLLMWKCSQGHISRIKDFFI